MQTFLAIASRLAGLSGIALCVGAGLGRLLGLYRIGGFETQTLFIGGIGLLAFAAYAGVERLLRSTPRA